MDFPANSFNPNKHLKEQLFVTNLTGSSMIEIFSLSTAVSILILLRRAIGFNYYYGFTTSKIASRKNDDHKNDVASNNVAAYIGSMLVDFLFILVPALLFHTVLADHIHAFAIFLGLSLLCIIASRYPTSQTANLSTSSSLRISISSYRVATMIVTCLSILAVDFTIFPRRYAKTETYGTGWMDLGVGSFVLANALVSRQARNVSSVTWKKTLQSTCPLILLGFGRLLSTTGVDYQVHVGEYGVHWNFFFTLAAVSILSHMINIHPRYAGIIGVLILSVYQGWLSLGLNEYLLWNERSSDIISQNKEGIFSIFGYWGMYMIGVHLGYLLFFRSNSSAINSRSTWTRSQIWVLSSVFWLLTMFFEKHVERVSRRMCNVAYVSLVCAVNFQVLAILTMSEYTSGSKFSLLEEAFDQNLLALFLLANVLTGLVNLSVDTLAASPAQALVILTIYAFVLCFFSGIVHFYGMRFKFW